MSHKLLATLLATTILVNVCTANKTVVSGGTGQDFSDRTPVNCFHCMSKEGGPCYDPIDVNDDAVKSQSCPSGICLKYIQNLENDIKQIDRGCADNTEKVLLDKGKTDGCVLSTGTKMVKVQICNCMGDDCNSVAEMKSTASMILAGSVLAMVIAKIMQ